MLLRQSQKGVTVTRILFWNSGTLTRASRVSSTSMTRQPFPAPPPTHQQAVKDPLKFLILAPARNTDWRERRGGEMAERFDWTWPPQVCYILNPANSLEPYVLNPAYSSIVTKFDLTTFALSSAFPP